MEMDKETQIMGRNAYRAHSNDLEQEAKRAAKWLLRLSKKAKKSAALQSIATTMPATGEGYWRIEEAVKHLSQEQLVKLVCQIAFVASEPEVEAEPAPLFELGEAVELNEDLTTFIGDYELSVAAVRSNPPGSDFFYYQLVKGDGEKLGWGWIAEGGLVKKEQEKTHANK